MNASYLLAIAGLYLFCVHLNYLWFNDLAKKYTNRLQTDLSWALILSGPILTGITLFVVIRGKIRIILFKRRIRKEVERQVPDLLKKFNITVIDD